MACDCDIRSCIERLEANGQLEGDLSVLHIILLPDVDRADKDSFLFEDHMRIEDEIIYPLLSKEARDKGMMEHAIMRNFRARGLPVPDSLFDAHKAWEKVEFFRVGR